MKSFLKISALIIALSITLCACSNQPQKSPTKKVDFKLDESLYSMSENLDDFTFALNGKAIDFPIYYSDFQKSGWKITKSDSEKSLEPMQYGVFEVEQKNGKMGIYFANFKNETAKLEDLAVCGVVAEYDEKNIAELPQGLKLGSAKKESIIKAFGEPQSEKENEMVYSFDEKSEVKLGFKNGVLNRIDAKTIADPLYLNASDEVPEIVKSYKAPKELSTKLKDFTFYLYGKTYTMPLPVSVLIENGWILAAKTDDYILPNETYKGGVKLTTLNRTLTFDIKNLADYPTTAENCFITAIESKYDMKLDMVLGYSWIRVGVSESTFLNTFSKKNFTEIKKTKKKTEYIYEAPEKGKIVVTAKEGYISRISVSLKEE